MNFCKIYNKSMNLFFNKYPMSLMDLYSCGRRINVDSINIFVGIGTIIVSIMIVLLFLIGFSIYYILTKLYDITTSKCEVK